MHWRVCAFVVDLKRRAKNTVLWPVGTHDAFKKNRNHFQSIKWCDCINVITEIHEFYHYNTYFLLLFLCRSICRLRLPFSLAISAWLVSALPHSAYTYGKYSENCKLHRVLTMHGTYTYNYTHKQSAGSLFFFITVRIVLRVSHKVC